MTATEMGEYVVGAWLREVAGCDFVDYNVRPPVGGSEGQSEFDVVGLHFRDRTAYLCEVAIYLDGLNNGNYSETLARVTRKHRRQREYAGALPRKLITTGRCHHREGPVSNPKKTSRPPRPPAGGHSQVAQSAGAGAHPRRLRS